MEYQYKVQVNVANTLFSKIKRIGKKLDKAGFAWKLDIGPQEIIKVPVYKVDHRTSTKYWVNNVGVEVIYYNFEMETLKLGDWTPIAIIEHEKVEIKDKGIINVVKMLNNEPIPKEWYHLEPKCEHCNSNRFRSKTIMLYNENEGYKQVGSTCVNEFTGIDKWNIINGYWDIFDIIDDENDFCHEGYLQEEIPRGTYTDTVEYLARCIENIEKVGHYVKDSSKEETSTKLAAYEDIIEYGFSASEDSLNKAKDVINVLTSNYIEIYGDAFAQDIAKELKNPFCAVNGRVAYAYCLYQKILPRYNDYINFKGNYKESNYFGEIGERVTLEVTYLDKKYAGENQFGTNYSHHFVDSQGNYFTWKTTKEELPIEIGNKVELIGTVLYHIPYNDIKRTALNRCKFKS